MSNTNNQNTKNGNTVVFDGNKYSYSDMVAANGDSIRTYHPVELVKPGQLYTVKHVSSPDGTQRLLTREESGQLAAGNEVRISPTSDWGKTLIQAFPRWQGQFLPSEDYSKKPWLLRQLSRILGYKQGGWLHKFQGGGGLQQAISPEQDVMNTIDAASGEIQMNRPGQAVQKLAVMMQDPNYSMIIDMLKQEYPQVENVLNIVERMIGAYKCGGKTKKKVKKGAKGCVPCKKLMRVGGKLINVLTDCEGNIVSKHQAGGWLIPKGEDGMLTLRRNALLNTGHTKDWLTQQEGITKTGVGKKYYQGADGFVYSIEGTANGWGPSMKLGRYIQSEPGGTYQLTDEEGNLVDGGHSFDAASMISATDATNAKKAYTSTGNTQLYYDPTTKKWYNATYNMLTKAWDTTGEASHENFGDDDLYAGGNWLSGTITREGATAAGIDSSKFNIEAPTVRGVRGKGGNSLFGEAAVGPTAQDYIDQYGFLGALNNEGRLRRSRLLEAKQDRRAASRAALKNGLFGQGQLRAINQEWRDSRDEIKSQHKAQTAALINAYTGRSHSTVGTPNLTTGSMTHTPAGPTQTTPAKKEEYTIMLKQGGWLTKFN